jgi:FkbM family methyltransferase
MAQKKSFYEAAKSANLSICKVAEIGVFRYECSVVREFIEAGIECHLYEPVPTFCETIEVALGRYPMSKLFRFALSDTDKELELYLAGDVGASTFSADISASPAILNDDFKPSRESALTVECRDFAKVDPGDYDLVSIDVEGAEWPIIKSMKSRPVLLAIETHFRNYRNPNLAQIHHWAMTEGYNLWYVDESDSIFIRGEPPKKSFFDRLANNWKTRKVYR